MSKSKRSELVANLKDYYRDNPTAPSFHSAESKIAELENAFIKAEVYESLKQFAPLIETHREYENTLDVIAGITPEPNKPEGLLDEVVLELLERTEERLLE